MRKSKYILIVACLIILAAFLFSCGESASYTLIYTAGAGGHISGESIQTVADKKDGKAVTAVPDDGYVFDCWSDGETEAVRQDFSVSGNKFVTASFKKSGFTFNYIAGEGGQVKGAALQTVAKGQSGAAVEAVPDKNYVFLKWSDGKTDALRTDANASGDISVTAVFLKKTFILVYTAGANGKINGSAVQIAEYGGNASEVTAVPDEHYYFTGWSDGVTTAARIDVNICADKNVTALFSALKYNLSYSAVQGGKIIGDSVQQVEAGGNGTSVTAQAETGYKFDGWSDGCLYAERTDINVLSDICVQARFSKIKFQCLYVAGTGGKIIGDAQQWIEYGGGSSAVAAVPDAGYYFERWSDGITTQGRTEIDVQANILVYAIFTQSYSGGEGTLSNPYKISKAADLANIVNHPDKHFVFINDIFLPAVGPGQSNFTPLCSKLIPFTGSLDGAGYTLANLTIHSNAENIGLFAYIGSTGNVKNLVISNALITEPAVGGANNVGVLAGESEGIIADIKVSGNIYYGNYLSGSTNIGGIVGICTNKIADCVSDINIYTIGIISAGLQRNELTIGGIAGWMSGYEYDIGTCVFGGKIFMNGICEARAPGSLYLGIGGIAGVTINARVGSQKPLANSHFTGEIAVTIKAIDIYLPIWVGGLIGWADSITDCSSTGEISLCATGNNLYTYIGGAAGDVVKISNTFYTGNILFVSENKEMPVNDSQVLFAGGLAGRADYTTGCYATSNLMITFSDAEMEYLYYGGRVNRGISIYRRFLCKRQRFDKYNLFKKRMVWLGIRRIDRLCG